MFSTLLAVTTKTFRDDSSREASFICCLWAQQT